MSMVVSTTTTEKVSAAIADPSSTLGRSTISLAGLNLVSTGLYVGIVDIWQATTITARTIKAKTNLLTMRARFKALASAPALALAMAA